jgi:hypothetical protein
MLMRQRGKSYRLCTPKPNKTEIRLNSCTICKSKKQINTKNRYKGNRQRLNS